MRTSCVLSGWGVAVLLAVAGCSDAPDTAGRTDASRPRRMGDSASRRLPDVNLAMVEPIAAQALRAHFRIDDSASTASYLVARPADAPELEHGGQSGDILSLTPRRKRRLGELRMIQESGAVLVQVRVMTQRLSTTERASFARQMGDDRPSEVQMDHRAASAGGEHEEWVDWQRDRKLEEQILREIQLAFAATQPATRTESIGD